MAMSWEDPDTGCWLWMGCLNRDGYGRINLSIDGKIVCELAHRVAYRELIGPIPPGHDLDHRPTCLRRCIHPEHVKPEPYLAHRLRTGFPKANAPRSI